MTGPTAVALHASKGLAARHAIKFMTQPTGDQFGTGSIRPMTEYSLSCPALISFSCSLNACKVPNVNLAGSCPGGSGGASTSAPAATTTGAGAAAGAGATAGAGAGAAAGASAGGLGGLLGGAGAGALLGGGGGGVGSGALLAKHPILSAVVQHKAAKFGALSQLASGRRCA